MPDPVQFTAPEAPAPTPVPTTPIVKPKSRGGGIVNVVLVLAALVAVGGIAFAAGRSTAPATTAGAFPGGPNGFPGGANGFPNGSFDPANLPAGAFGGGRTTTINGTVKSVDGTTMVVTDATGTDRTIDIAATTYHSQAAATASDVTPGTTVQVSVDGPAGFRGEPPVASGAPDASAAPGLGSLTATDVLVTSGQ